MKSSMDDDLMVLKIAGINSVDELVASAAEFVRHSAFYRLASPSNALTESEQDFLKNAGARGVGDDFDQTIIDKMVAKAAADYASLVAASLTQKEVATYLGVSASRVRQRIDTKTLYAINTSQGRVCPIFQFKDQKTLPGIEEVLPVLSDEAHPLAVFEFFKTPSSDLEMMIAGAVVDLSPIKWLELGGASKDVILLAKGL